VEELRYEKELLQWQLTHTIDLRQEPVTGGYGRGVGFSTGGAMMYGQYRPGVREEAQDVGGVVGGVRIAKGGGGYRGMETRDDRHIIAKHANIYPTEQDVSHIVI